ncbi:GH3 family domain-containing protein [Fodinibius sp. Rm-B-1B1-1]|uniref:GH3 family domain-containing protein n=1 Tax=Fodinibius alkaliphilus TaxID=3140241 RepID=UPI00315A0C01
MTIREIQQQQLFRLLHTAQDTEFGQQYDFKSIDTLEEFTGRIPISFYEDIKSRIESLKQGKENIFWPGKVNKYAVSAGTSGEGKHLPLTDARLDADRSFMRKVVLNYLKQHPNIFDLWGKHISIPGTLEKKDRYQIGEISAYTAQQAPWWLTPFQLIDPTKLSQLPFDEKVNQTVTKAINSDIRVITAVPSWILTMFKEVLNKTGASNIREVWPNLTLLVCGGVKLANYKPHLEKLLDKPDVSFIETYGASEGYFSFTDKLAKKDMKLVADNGIFYEFVPNPLPDQDSMAVQETVPLWDVKPNTPYAMLVTTNSGLWRYALNDIVEFTQTDPPRIKVMGRVSEMLDDYGEALYAYEAEEALHNVSEEMNFEVGNFTIGAILEDDASAPKHIWFIRTETPLHRDTLNTLSQKIDQELRKINRHYAIRRESSALTQPDIHTISQQQINNWLASKGKDKAQGKLPAILRNKQDITFFQ